MWDERIRRDSCFLHKTLDEKLNLFFCCFQYRPIHVFVINVFALFVCFRVGKTLIVCLTINFSRVITIVLPVLLPTTSVSHKKKT